MAIEIDLETSQYGTPFAGAYFRIVTAAVSRMRSGDGPKFTVMIDVAGYATSAPGDDTREVDFRRYHADYADIEAAAGAEFLDKCYAWVMAQEDMAGEHRGLMGIVVDYTSGFHTASPSGEKVGSIASGTLDLSTGNVFSNAPSANVTGSLQDTDWMALSDTTMTPEWAAYRQALRDITGQIGFPYSVEWPIKPETEE